MLPRRQHGHYQSWFRCSTAALRAPATGSTQAYARSPDQARQTLTSELLLLPDVVPDTDDEAELGVDADAEVDVVIVGDCDGDGATKQTGGMA